MKRFRITAIFCILMLCISLPVCASNRVDSDDFARELAYLQSIFVHGEYWNGYNANGYESSGPIACPSCSSIGRYSCRGCSDKCGAFIYNGEKVAGQCLGFVFKMGSMIFGGNPVDWEKHKDASRLQAGDIIYGNIGPMFDRASTNHGVFVTAVTQDTVTFGDCNWGGPCKIRWGKTVARSKVKASMGGANIYHAPNNNVGIPPEILLSAAQTTIDTGKELKVDWLAPIGATVKLQVDKKGSKSYASYKTLTPKGSPYSLGKLPVGQYKLTLTATKGSRTLKEQMIVLVYVAEPMNFIDVKGKDWFYKNGAVSYVYSKGMFAGVSAKEFGPYNPMTRAMFVTVLGRMNGVTPDHAELTEFKDVPTDTWYSGYVAWAVKQGITSGVGKKRFAPDDAITREQICALLTRYAASRKITLSNSRPIRFTDADRISDWAKESVEKCAAAAVVNGFPEGNELYFRPTKTATRAEVATMLCEFIRNT